MGEEMENECKMEKRMEEDGSQNILIHCLYFATERIIMIIIIIIPTMMIIITIVIIIINIILTMINIGYSIN